MKRMLKDEVKPKIKKLLGDQASFHASRTICCFGLPESLVGEKVEAITKHFPKLKLGLRAKFPEIQVKLYGKTDSEEKLERQFDLAANWVKSQLGSHIFSEDGQSMEAVVGQLLRLKGATIAVAESCTGGLIAHRLTNVAGSSDYFLLSAVTYANEAKSEVLSVDPELINTFGAVSKETAAAMAQGVRNLAKSTYGLAVSGIAGPGGGTPAKPVGTLCIAVSGPDGTQAYKHQFNFGRRQMLKSIFAMAALNSIREKLNE